MKLIILLLGLGLVACQTQQQTASTKTTARTASGRTVWSAPPTGSLLGGGYSASGDSATSASPTPSVDAAKALPAHR